MTIWWPIRTSHACARADHMHNHGNMEFRTYEVSKPQGSHNVNKTDMSYMRCTVGYGVGLVGISIIVGVTLVGDVCW